MGRCVRGQRGGIAGLVFLLREYGEAIEYHLLTMGRHIDELGHTLSWRDLLVIVKQAPRGSSIRRALDPHDDQTWEIELLRAIEVNTHATWWMQSRDGQRGNNKPAPMRFPWDPKPKRVIDADVMTVDQMRTALGWE